jgi:hypothetical protein
MRDASTTPAMQDLKAKRECNCGLLESQTFLKMQDSERREQMQFDHGNSPRRDTSQNKITKKYRSKLNLKVM